MRVSILVVMAIATLIGGCGKQLVEFKKDGVSRTMMLKDDENCWAEARAKLGKMTESEKSRNMVEGAATMGVVGVIGAAAVNSGADDPRATRYIGSRNDCMRAKGYGVGWAQN